MKKLFKFLDGNKTIIGFALLNITQLSFIKSLLGADLIPIQAIIGALTGASIVHHAKKGKFNTKNN